MCLRRVLILKAIILSATTGGGHIRAANAIKLYLEEFSYEVIVLDTLEYINPILNKTITEGYEFIVRKKPSIYKVMYNTSNKKSIVQAIAKINSLISKKLVPLINEYDPDIVITTHPFSTEMVSRLKGLRKIDAPIICIMTDYSPHRTWINDNVDAYVVSNDEMIKSMYDMGVPYWKVYPYGIPIDEAFYERKDRSIVLEEIGLDPKLPMILIMAGSLGVGNILEIYKGLLDIPINFQIVVITGRNEKLYGAIQEIICGINKKKHHVLKSFKRYVSNIKFRKLRFIKKHSIATESETMFRSIHKKNTKILYFTDQVDKYMKTADLIITKPGGLTITEALACNLPMAIFDAIPGQEQENADFLVSNNMAIRLKNGTEGIDEIKNLLQNINELESMKSSCRTFAKSDSLKKIKNLIERICQKNKVE